jgi:NADH:ubiquinone oxidoreductase subunit 3 (subunit A)
MNDTVVAIVSAFFIIGIAVGIIVVVALSVLRTDRRGDQGDHADPYGPGEPTSGSGRDDTRPDGHSRWPGDADTDFRGR